MTRKISSLSAAIMAALFVGLPMQAHALFEDADARREILNLRKRLEELNARIDSRLTPQLSQIDEKADKKGMISLVSDIEKLRAEMAALRGQIEVLSNELTNAQRRQKDFYSDLDQRLRKLEPQRMSIDGKDVEVHRSEQAAFDKGLAEFRAANYAAANQSFSSFLQRYPESGYLPQAYFWLGSTFFAQQDCTNAIQAYQTVTTRFPTSQKAPEALLNIASCQLDLKDKAGARETLEQLLKKYPASVAAAMGKERLAEIKQ